jgi:hypothetical protein
VALRTTFELIGGERPQKNAKPLIFMSVHNSNLPTLNSYFRLRYAAKSSSFGVCCRLFADISTSISYHTPYRCCFCSTNNSLHKQFTPITRGHCCLISVTVWWVFLVLSGDENKIILFSVRDFVTIFSSLYHQMLNNDIIINK